MSSVTHWAASGRLAPESQLRYAREIIAIEGQALAKLAERIDDNFRRAVEIIERCRGSVMVTGMGKAGLIAQKVAATFASTGTRSHFLHPAEAVHGDLGRIHADDAIVILSQSGETEEIVRLLPTLTSLKIPLIAVTGRRTNSVGRVATTTIELGPLEEACALGLAPSTSTTAMLAIGDALALVVSRSRDFRAEDFARFHPAGSLGRQLSKVEDYWRDLTQCRVANCSQTVRQVLVESRTPGRRTGAIMIVDPQGILRGIFTDSDLARLFESRRDAALDESIRLVMTKRPTSVPVGSMMVNAVAIMAERKISELPVVDAEGRPKGMIDITDVVSMLPEPKTEFAATQSSRSATSPPARSSGPPPPKNPLFTQTLARRRSSEQTPRDHS